MEEGENLMDTLNRSPEKVLSFVVETGFLNLLDILDFFTSENIF